MSRLIKSSFYVHTCAQEDKGFLNSFFEGVVCLAVDESFVGIGVSESVLFCQTNWPRLDSRALRAE